MAIDELNAQKLKIGGKDVKFELMAEDDQADPKMGRSSRRSSSMQGERRRRPLQFRRDDSRVVGVLDAGIPQLSVSTNVKYTQQGYKTAFRLMADDGKQGKALGEYAVKTLKLKRLAVDRRRDGVRARPCRRVRESGQGAGGTVTKHEHTNDKAVDFAAVLTSIKATESESDLLRRLRPAGGPMAKQMKQLGMDKVKLMGGETMNSAKFVELAGTVGRRRHRVDAGRGPPFASRRQRRSPTSTRRASAPTSASMRRTSTMA
jgi:branched-chain amino acid transport system substrate-binding protein